MSNENNWHYYDPANHGQADVDEVNCFQDEISIPIRQNKSSNNAIMKAQNNKSKKNKLPIMDPKEVEDEKNQEKVEEKKSEHNHDNNNNINQVATYKRDELLQPQNAQPPLDEYTRLNRLNFLFMDIGNTDYQKQIKNINLDSPGVKVLEDWIKTGDMPKQANITYCDLCEFVIKAENDQYSRAHTNLNLPKDTNNIFNRGTSLWFRSDQKKRANYLYELIEDN